MKLQFVVQDSASGCREEALRLAVQVLPEAATAMMLVAGNLPLLTPHTLEQAALEGARRKAAGTVHISTGEEPSYGPGQGLQWAPVPLPQEGLAEDGAIAQIAMRRHQQTVRCLGSWPNL